MDDVASVQLLFPVMFQFNASVLAFCFLLVVVTLLSAVVRGKSSLFVLTFTSFFFSSSSALLFNLLNLNIKYKREMRCQVAIFGHLFVITD